MKPAALREVRVVRVEEGGALVLSGARGEVVVEPLEAAIWQAADGTLEVSALAEIAGEALGQRVEVWEVWSALDVLGELGLMAEVAAAPPAAVGRRDALRWFGQAAGAAALLVMGAGQARAEDAVAEDAVPADAQPVPADAPEAKKMQEAQAKQREVRKREEMDTKAKRQEEKKKRDLASDKKKEVRQEEREKQADVVKDRTAADAPPSDAEAKKRSEYEAKKADDRATPAKKKQVDGKKEAHAEEDAKKQKGPQ